MVIVWLEAKVNGFFFDVLKSIRDKIDLRDILNPD